MPLLSAFVLCQPGTARVGYWLNLVLAMDGNEVNHQSSERAAADDQLCFSSEVSYSWSFLWVGFTAGMV